MISSVIRHFFTDDFYRVVEQMVFKELIERADRKSWGSKPLAVKTIA